MRGGAPLLVLALVGTVLAGCADDPDGLTAMEAEGIAREAALKIAPDASLRSLSMAETRQADPPGKDEPGINPGQDAVTDGRADRWVFLYTAGNDMILVEVEGRRATASPLAMSTGPGSLTSPAIDLALWKVDSEAAAAAAVAHDPRVEEIAKDPEGAFALTLLAPAGKPAWMVLAGYTGADEAHRPVVLRVDAETGETEAADLLSFFEDAVGFQEGDWIQGRVTALEPVRRHGFEVASNHSKLALVVVPGDNVPFQNVRFSVEGPDGSSASVEGSGGGTMVLSGTAGTYDVEVELMQGALFDYEIHWCTDGLPVPMVSNEACAHVD